MWYFMYTVQYTGTVYSIVVIIRLYFIFYDEDKCTVPGISLISASRVQTSFDIPPLRLACLLSTLLLRLKFEEDRGGLPLMPGRLILLLLVERACAESALPRDGLRPWLSIIVDQSPESNSALPSSRVGWSKAYDDSRSRLPILRPKYVLRVSYIHSLCEVRLAAFLRRHLLGLFRLRWRGCLCQYQISILKVRPDAGVGLMAAR